MQKSPSLRAMSPFVPKKAITRSHPPMPGRPTKIQERKLFDRSGKRV